MNNAVVWYFIMRICVDETNACYNNTYNSYILVFLSNWFLFIMIMDFKLVYKHTI